MNLRKEDIETLRTLAERMMNDALSDKNHEKRELWRSLNQMHMQKPMISIEQMPWDELDVDGSLVCTVENKVFRGIEWNLRTNLYKWEHMPADMVLNPYILLPRPISNTGYGLSTVYKEVPRRRTRAVPPVRRPIQRNGRCGKNTDPGHHGRSRGRDGDS
ncbi:MAG: hypothetical protein GX929_01095 [Clostridiales bacterium]|jgi:hypothetical protein|nr:hypothetical protein [Clostridiales bacterium]